MPYSGVSDVETTIGKVSGYYTTETKPTKTQVEEFISRADSMVDEFTGHQWGMQVAEDEYYTGYGDGIINLTHAPVLEVTLVEFWNGADWEEAVAGRNTNNDGKKHYSVFKTKGQIKFFDLHLSDEHPCYRVNYTYGFESLPTNIKNLSAMVAGIMTLMFGNTGKVAAWNLGDSRVQYSNEDPLVSSLQAQVDQLTWRMRRPMAGTA